MKIGLSPVANRLLTNAFEPVEYYPLGLAKCASCGLVQNSTSLPSDALFGAEYAYLSSVSAAVKNNARDLAARIVGMLGCEARVLDIGSNDGTLQHAFRAVGIDCIGVDPSAIPVAYARQAGLTSYCMEFNADTARHLKAQGERVSAITMSNVLAHVSDPLSMLQAVRTMLTQDDGLLVVEVQSWRDLVSLGAFDMVYHEHHSHFSLGSLLALLERADFSVFDVQHTTMQGGSLRAWCRPGGSHATLVQQMAEIEAEALATDRRDLKTALQRCRASAARFLDAAKGRRTAGYGAAAKTVTLPAALETDLGMCCVADKAPSKIGKYLPYEAIPIVSPRQMLEEGAEVILIFAWNLKDEILPELDGREAWVPFPDFMRIQ
jgi:hypothetical protein